MSHVDAPAPQRRRGSSFWTVAYAYLIVTATATLPSPLYGLYRTRDDLSAFTITIVFAIFAAGSISALLAVSSVVARIGRRGTMLTATATMIASMALLAIWKDLPGLLLGRLLTGVAVGLAAGTALPYLIELSRRADPPIPLARARTIGTVISIAALGVGPLLGGLLAQWVPWPLTVPYLLFIALGATGLGALTTAPETGTPAAPAGEVPVGRLHRARLPIPVPAAAATLTAFAANGLFAGLSGLILASALHRTSHALAGTTLFLVFAAGVTAQLATARLRATGVLAAGTVSMLAGLVFLATTVRLPAPSLALFLISGALIGAGSGAMFKGITALVLEASAPQDRVAVTAALLISLYVGLSVPVIGVGIALDRGAGEPDTILVFATLTGLGVFAAGLALLVRRPRSAP